MKTRLREREEKSMFCLLCVFQHVLFAMCVYVTKESHMVEQ